MLVLLLAGTTGPLCGTLGQAQNTAVHSRPGGSFVPLLPTAPTATETPTPTPTDTPSRSPVDTRALQPGLSYDSSHCGQTIVIPDGRYARLVVNASCTNQSPLIIRAENEGGVFFDGQDSGRPCEIDSSSWVSIEGITCHDSPDTVVGITDSEHLYISKVTAYQAGPDYNDHVFNIHRSSHITLEDCAASGRGRNQYIAYESDFVTFRRCWGRVTDPPYCNPSVGRCADWMQIYGTADSIIENCIGVRAEELPDAYVNANQYWYASYNRDQDRVDRNRIIGSVFYGHDYHGLNVISANQQLHGNSVENSVFIGNDTGTGYGTPYSAIYQRCDDDFTMDHLTLVNHRTAVNLTHNVNNPWFDIIGSLTNSSILSSTTGINLAHYSQIHTSLDHHHNNFHNVDTPYSGTSQGAGEIFGDPGYDVSRYGKGAYLFPPVALQGQGADGADIGAEVLYRSIDGHPTNQPLWPWPLEARICAETAHILGDGINGISVTYESRQAQYDYDRDGQLETYECTGGIWKSLAGYQTFLPHVQAFNE